MTSSSTSPDMSRDSTFCSRGAKMLPGPEVKPITVTDETPIGIDDDGRLRRTMIVKPHGASGGHRGDLTWATRYVVTEDNYIDYAPGALPKRVLEKA